MEIDKVVDNMVAQMLVNDPIHELEACKGDGEKDTAVLVNVRSCHSEHLVQVLHVAFGIGRWGVRGASARGSVIGWGSRFGPRHWWAISRIIGGCPHGQWWSHWGRTQWRQRSPHHHVGMRGHHVHKGWGGFFIIPTHRRTPPAVLCTVFGSPLSATGGWSIMPVAPSPTARASPCDGVFARTTLTVHFWVVHLKVNRL